MSEIALTVIGVVKKNDGVPALRGVMAAQPPKPARAEAPAAETLAAALGGYPAAGRKEGAESSTRFGARGRGETTPFTIPFTTHPCGWLLRVGLEGG